MRILYSMIVTDTGTDPGIFKGGPVEFSSKRAQRWGFNRGV